MWWNPIAALNLVTWSRSLFEMITLSQFSHFLILVGRGCCRSLNVLFLRAPFIIYWPLGDLNKNFDKWFSSKFLVIDGWHVFCKIPLRWMSLYLNDEKSALVQLMAWCRQATSHYLSQRWSRSVSPYDIIRPQWVNTGLNNELVLFRQQATI